MDPNSDTQDIVDNTATKNTGEQRQVNNEGRIANFNKRFARFKRSQ